MKFLIFFKATGNLLFFRAKKEKRIRGKEGTALVPC
jgi:hypothetical protein